MSNAVAYHSVVQSVIEIVLRIHTDAYTKEATSEKWSERIHSVCCKYAFFFFHNSHAFMSILVVIDTNLDCFSILDIVNKAVMNKKHK